MIYFDIFVAFFVSFAFDAELVPSTDLSWMLTHLALVLLIYRHSEEYADGLQGGTDSIRPLHFRSHVGLQYFVFMISI